MSGAYAAGTRSWETLAEVDGVVLRASGQGEPLLVLPGMEGDGTSCLQLVGEVQRALADRRALRVVLVDYAAEQQRSLEELESVVVRLVGTAGLQPAVVWGQSFGCLLAASVARTTRPSRLVLVSPFTDLPASRDVAARLLAFVPRPLYRATSTPVCRWVFGPAHGQEGAAFLASLREGDPVDVSRRASWLRDRDRRDHFEGLLDERAAVWFGTRDRLVDLRGQLEVFAELGGEACRPCLVPRCGHVVLPATAVAFLTERLTAWLAG